MSYKIHQNPPRIECKECGIISYNSNDVLHKYCGKCKKFHEDEDSFEEIYPSFLDGLTNYLFREKRMKISIIGSDRYRKEKDEAIEIFRAKDFGIFDICKMVDANISNPHQAIDESNLVYLVSGEDGYAGVASAINCCRAKSLEIPIFSNIAIADEDFSSLVDRIAAPEEVEEINTYSLTRQLRIPFSNSGVDNYKVLSCANNPEFGNGIHKYQVRDLIGKIVANIKFQTGALGLTTVNGLLSVVYLQILIDHLQSFQTGELKNRETEMAIIKLEEAYLWLVKRAEDRGNRNVLGTIEK